MPDLVIRNARLVLPDGIVRGELSIEERHIQEIAVSGLPKGEREIDAGDNIVMPGAIDAHVHFYDEKFLHREDFRSGSTAAVAGGVTTVIVMPLDTPIFSPKSIREAIAAGRKDCVIDFAFHAGNMTAGSMKYVPQAASLGVKSFKTFTCAPYHMTYEKIGDLMNVVRVVGGVTFVHAEDDEILHKRTQRILAERRKDPLAHHDARPNAAEEKATETITQLVKRMGCRTHLAHITTRQACDIIREAKMRRLPISAETSPHFLIFTRKDISRLGPFLKTNPSLKTSEDRAALWDALASGVIDIVATDHAPGTRKEKDVGWNDIWKAQTGVPGVETLLPLMLTEGVAKGRLALEKMVDIICTKPAQIFDLYPRKGVIREGSDADLVVVDLKRETVVAARNLHYKVGWTPYEGMRVKGIPKMVISRGTVLVDEGEIVGKPKHGQFLAR